MAVGFSLLCFLCATTHLAIAIPTAQQNYTNGLRFKTVFSRRSLEEPILMLYKLPVKECVYECQIRTECHAVNYWRLRKQCQLLPLDTNDLNQTEAGKPCVYIRKADVVESPEYPLTSLCPVACGMDEVCDPVTKLCVVKECRHHYQHNATVTGNVHSVGSRIRVGCNKWYVPSYFSWCQQNGSWSPIIQCKYQFECELPPYFPNAWPHTHTYKYKAQIPENLAVKYLCDKGYKAPNNFNNMTIQCSSMVDPALNATWEEPQFECIRNCWSPPRMTNATASPGENLENMTKVYSCLPGYELNNDSNWLNENETIVLNTTCQTNGKWTDVNFECIPVCGIPPEIQYGFAREMIDDGTSLYLAYKCRRTIDTKYNMAAPYTNTDTKVECLNGTWDEPHFHCVADCMEPPPGINVTANAILVSDSNTLEDAVRRYTCELGFEPVGNYTITCKSSGNWTDVNFECVPVCNIPPAIHNAVFQTLYADPVVSTAEFTCVTGYSLPNGGNSLAVTCSDPGPWFQSEFCLIERPEPPPSIKKSMTVSSGDHLEGSSRSYSCITGYHNNDKYPMSITCQSNGTWTPGDFRCEPNWCPIGWQRVEGSCYFFENVAINVIIDDVMTYCQTNVDPNAFMLHIESAEKQSWVEELLQTSTAPSWCLGLHNPAGDGNWVWTGTNNSLSYSNWLPGQPNNVANEFVAKVSSPSYQWRDTDTDCTPVCEISTD